MVAIAQSKGVNPWLVQDLSDFYYLCCPECDFRTKIEDFFEHHAVNKHPSSIDFFSAEVFNEELVKTELVEHMTNIKPEAIEGRPDSKLNIGSYSSVELDPLDLQLAQNGYILEPLESKSDLQLIKNKEPADCEENGLDDDLPYGCPKCHEEITGLVNLGVHLNKAHIKDSKSWQCPACDHSLSGRNKMRNHVLALHLKLKVECKICQAKLNPTSMRIHMQGAHGSDRGNKSFRCEQCDFSTYALMYLKAHVKKVHEKEKRKHGCDQCSKKFLFECELKAHKESSHEGIRRFMCDKCGKSFQTKTMLHYHNTRDICGAPVLNELIKCEKCDDTFTARKYYVMHYQNIHGGDPRPVSPTNAGQLMCDQCPNVYLTQQGLTKHMMSAHLGIKDVQRSKLRKCEQCEKAFTTLASLKEHVVVKHEQSTPYQCDQCHRSYGTKTRLRTHKQNMHRRVKCDECSQEICNNFMLKRHKASVHNTKPTNVYQCEFCPLFYNMEIALEKHVTKHHSHSIS